MTIRKLFSQNAYFQNTHSEFFSKITSILCIYWSTWVYTIHPVSVHSMFIYKIYQFYLMSFCVLVFLAEAFFSILLLPQKVNFDKNLFWQKTSFSLILRAFSSLDCGSSELELRFKKVWCKYQTRLMFRSDYSSLVLWVPRAFIYVLWLYIWTTKSVYGRKTSNLATVN